MESVSSSLDGFVSNPELTRSHNDHETMPNIWTGPGSLQLYPTAMLAVYAVPHVILAQMTDRKTTADSMSCGLS